MIYDSIQNIQRYKGLSSHMDVAIDFILSNGLDGLTEGKHNIQGENVFVLMNVYETRKVKDCPSETHKKYIDIQVMLEGREGFGHAFLAQQTVIDGYHSDKDYTFYDGPMDYLVLNKGQFAVFYPSDIHQPGIALDVPLAVKKAVFKVRVE
ncbi:MAG: YhcH/YjgK/YiaL family protein [Salinivirgaceae bacterium]